MAIKKSEIYATLWASCDELRGSMDASQYKDYILVLLFMKYVSDKKDRLMVLEPGTTFTDMLAARNQTDIGERLNTIISKFAQNNNLDGIITEADFDDSNKLGQGKEKVDRLSNLLNIFNRPELNFANNRTGDDDLLGDAYEYLMKHFATQSGKSKGQFYTPSEVSRIMAQLIDVRLSKSGKDSIYDPTCGSASLLLKAAELAPHISIYGQEYDNATRALAVMNMWLHGHSTAEVKLGNTLASPQLFESKSTALKQFDYAVANPPFSYKAWTNGFVPESDLYGRFDGYGVPPQKNGDYAFLLHILKSLKSTGKACIVLPLGVLFRGNAEGEIRKNIVKRGYIKAIIGLPPNLFFGTGIAACLIVLDKQGTFKNKADESAIFIVDASKHFIKDGNKNRLREQDIHKVVDTYKNRTEIRGYSRLVPIEEIADPKNDYNLNIPRYIENTEPEDIHNIEAHLHGGLPKFDIDVLQEYWDVYPTIKTELLTIIHKRPNYYQLNVHKDEIKSTIFNHPEFTSYSKKLKKIFTEWKNEAVQYAQTFEKGIKPKEIIRTISESLLQKYDKKKLVDKYTIYQLLMDYWSETMQDDCYVLTREGWEAGNTVSRKIRRIKKGNTDEIKIISGIEGLEGALIPPTLIIDIFFAKENKTINENRTKIDELSAEMDELLEEHGGEEGYLVNAVDDKGKITKKSIEKALKICGKRTKENADEYDTIKNYKECMEDLDKVSSLLRSLLLLLEQHIEKKYNELTIEQRRDIVIERKWMAEMDKRITNRMDAISQSLFIRLKELTERYEVTLQQWNTEVQDLEKKVNKHLQKMGYTL